jgi:hypothetical protein
MLIEAPYVPVQEAPLVLMQAVHAGTWGQKARPDPVACFHIYLQPPKLEPIHATNLLVVADAGNTTVPGTATDALILADAATKTITPEIVRKINEGLTNSCSSSENPSLESRKAHLGGLSPGIEVVGKLIYDYGVKVAGEVKAVVIRQPAHGRIVMVSPDDQSFPGLSLEEFEYTPDKDFLGEDKAVFEVSVNGQKFRISYVIKVVHGGFNDACVPPGADSGALNPDVQIAIEDVQFLQDATMPETSTSWQSLFAMNEQVINSINLSFANLAGGAVGQTTGEGANATITLDDNAAGYGWFIDTTPADNNEFLPTSNPNEWVAKAGSAAYGKMDILSVLLHEYGHALGIEHSGDGGDYMGATLTPGVRRLPSAIELALMQQLIVEAKNGLAAGPPPTHPQGERGSGDAPTPFPTLPISLGGLAFAGLLRPNRFGGMNIDLVSAITPAPVPRPQYEVSANATFTSLNTASGWNTQGSVDIVASTGTGPSTGSGQSGSGSATLNEVSTSQTRLSQVFMLGDRDRYLSFTLSGAALDNMTGAPDDAFEVALLDANTGLSVLGNDGLTRTDAFLNLQGDGTQHTANSVTCIVNADGSRTYRVDLTGVAKNIAVNLSFDLLGFGQSNSHVTLRDVRVSGLPQLHDEVASIAEDNLLTFNPFAQIDAPSPTGGGLGWGSVFASHIVTAPTHGLLAMNADGTFSYTPTLNFFGADSFSYRLSDGPLDSNLATVSLTVTPVNDAPVAADAQVTTAEDTPLVIALGAYATDMKIASSHQHDAGLSWQCSANHCMKQ